MNTPNVRNIWAVGRNYAEHAKEMKAEVPSSPMFFLKAGSCLVNGFKIQLPNWSTDVHHELEIAFLLDKNLKYSHITLALDLTARDAQSLAKAKGLPWTQAKSFSGACPIGPWIDLNSLKTDMENLNFQLFKNEKLVQNGQFKDMIFKPDSLLEFVRNFYPICPHDVILTGTPEGVGPLKSSDKLKAVLQSGNQEILACHWDIV